MSHEATAEKQGNDDTPQHLQQQSESPEVKNIEFSDLQLSRLIELYSEADERERDAIVRAAECIRMGVEIGDAAVSDTPPKPDKRRRRS